MSVRWSSSFWYAVTSTLTPGLASSNSCATSSQKPRSGSPVPLCHHVRVTSSPSPPPPLPPAGAHAASEPMAMPVRARAAQRLGARLFIFEPLESFDFYVESSVDALNIRRPWFVVKRNIFRVRNGADARRWAGATKRATRGRPSKVCEPELQRDAARAEIVGE